ncbi:MAG TPA: hypothetical protein VEO00_03450, partial [Actinomycetota bacterium]|nr:hypothetical protein [Actinomycetota bacterium]
MSAPDTLTIEDLAEDTGEIVADLRVWHELGLLPGDPGAFPGSHLARVGLIPFASRRGFEPARLAEFYGSELTGATLAAAAPLRGLLEPAVRYFHR